jgi:hypothetical protein
LIDHLLDPRHLGKSGSRRGDAGSLLASLKYPVELAVPVLTRLLEAKSADHVDKAITKVLHHHEAH